MDLLFKSVKELCLTQGFEKTYWVGFSGGLDSHVLLHLLSRVRSHYPIKISTIYINHGLSPNATKWAMHCADVCNKLQVEFKACVVDIDPFSEESPEALARDHRYAVFAEWLAEKDVLLTAHHQDDQAETVLVQMLRGAGPKGMAAMPHIKPFAEGFHARPLLKFTRTELQNYAEQHQLQWIDDESNKDVKFVRNFLRHDVLPILKNRWPSVTNTLARVAENCAEMHQLLDEVISHDLRAVKGSVENTLSIQALLQLSSMRQRYVLRAWLTELHFPIPSFIKLQQIQQDMLFAREDKTPHFSWRGVELRRFRDDLYAMLCLKEHEPSQVIKWDFAESLQLPHLGMLSATRVPGRGIRLDVDNVTVRFRQGGEVLKLPGRQCSHALKNLFQEWGVPLWQRDRLPLIYVGEKLAAVVGYGIHEEFEVDEYSDGYVLIKQDEK